MIWTENGEVVGGKGALVCGGSGGSLSVFCSHRLTGSKKGYGITSGLRIWIQYSFCAAGQNIPCELSHID